MVLATKLLDSVVPKALGLERYELRHLLGKGGTGVVYEAYDRKTGALVALKTIEASATLGLQQLKQEFRALSHLHHPNLVRLGELSCENGQWFFTMELVRGTGFIDYVRPSLHSRSDAPTVSGGPPKSAQFRRSFGPRDSAAPSASAAREPQPSLFPAAFDEHRLRNMLAQLVTVVAAIHEAGHVHRDLKPQNLLVSATGRLVLLDFGLALALKHHRSLASRDFVAGTPAYMAPEQATGTHGSRAADWYAVGATLFRALTGRLPFLGSTEAMIQAKLTQEAPSPRQFVADLPQDLNDLCVDLLRNDPEARPKAREILARLGLGRALPVVSVPPSVDPSSVFVGRRGPLGALQTALADADLGRGRLVTVEGEPGVGKTALIQQFLETMASGATVLSGRCYEQESVPFKGVDDIIDGLASYLEDRTEEEMGVLLAGGIRFLAAVFPSLCRLTAVRQMLSEGRQVETESALRAQAFGEFARLLAALCKRGRVVVVIDDLQWADPDSFDLLLHLLGNGGNAACLFIVTLRTGADVPAEALALCALGQRIQLESLTAEESHLLWDTLSADQTHGRGAIDRREMAMKEAGGNPLFLAELARLAHNEALDWHSGARVKDVVLLRVLARDPLEQRFLEMVAIAGEPLPYEIIARAAELEVGECLVRLTELHASRLVRVARRGEARTVEPHHDRVREAILDHLAATPDGLRGIEARHLALGRALKDSDSRGALRHPIFKILHHLDAARELLVDPQERLDVAALHLRASREARLATAYETASYHAREGLGLVGEDGFKDAYPLTRDLSTEQMAAEHLGGRLEVAQRCFEVVRAQVKPGDDWTALHVAWINLETGRRRLREAIAVGRASMRHLGVRAPTRFQSLAVLLAFMETRRAIRGVDLNAWIRSAPHRDAAGIRSVALSGATSSAAFWCDKRLLAWLTCRTISDFMKQGFTAASPANLSAYGMMLAAVLGRYAEGAKFGQLALELQDRILREAEPGRLEQGGVPQVACKVYFLNGAFLTPWVRPFAEAIELLRISNDLSIKQGDTNYQEFASSVIPVFAFCASDDLGSVQTLAERASELSERLGNADTAEGAALLAHHAATLRGGRSEVREPVRDPARNRGVNQAARFMFHFCAAERAYLAGHSRDAEQHILGAKKHRGAVFGLPSRVELIFLDVLIAARNYESSAVFRRLGLRRRVRIGIQQLARWAKSCPGNFEPYYLIARAELARLRGHHVQARVDLERALATLQEHPAPKREGMALELWAHLADAAGEAEQAQALYHSAARAYRRWGALQKAAELSKAAELAPAETTDTE